MFKIFGKKIAKARRIREVSEVLTPDFHLTLILMGIRHHKFPHFFRFFRVKKTGKPFAI